ncbi:MAG: NUDIX domain-containing protein [Alphaproteobacteria bacterium]|nr:NUDIX domain-containing protein [Alphaproteobacteria bacterium]
MTQSRYRITQTEIMAKGWSSLQRLTVEANMAHGKNLTVLREVADHGHGAAILPVDSVRGTCLLVRQWRAGAAFTGHEGFLIEACAGLLDADDPEGCVRREAFEELGTQLRNISQVSTCFSSPGAVSEIVSLFIADYAAADRVGSGGGLEEEGEDIEVMELPLQQAFDMIATGEIMDAKTIILLQHVKLRLITNK